jgi:predicted small secreted protein
MYHLITKDIQESFHTLKRSKTIEILNSIKSDNKNLHGSIVVLHSTLVKKLATHGYEK